MASGSGTGTLYLSRPDHRVFGHEDAYIILDGQNVGTISNGQCVRLTISSGKHQIQVSPNAFANFGAAIGAALAKAFKYRNVDMKAGGRLYYQATPYYDSPQVGWMFSTTKKTSGRSC